MEKTKKTDWGFMCKCGHQWRQDVILDKVEDIICPKCKLFHGSLVTKLDKIPGMMDEVFSTHWINYQNHGVRNSYGLRGPY